MSGKSPVQVLVSKSGPNGRPMARLTVASSMTAAQLGAAVQHVVADPRIIQAAGLKACSPCKSGLDISVIEHDQEMFQFEV